MPRNYNCPCCKRKFNKVELKYRISLPSVIEGFKLLVGDSFKHYDTDSRICSKCHAQAVDKLREKNLGNGHWEFKPPIMFKTPVAEENSSLSNTSIVPVKKPRNDSPVDFSFLISLPMSLREDILRQLNQTDRAKFYKYLSEFEPPQCSRQVAVAQNVFDFSQDSESLYDSNHQNKPQSQLIEISETLDADCQEADIFDTESDQCLPSEANSPFPFESDQLRPAESDPLFPSESDSDALVPPSQQSIVSASSRASISERRLPMIPSVTSTQSACFICNRTGSKTRCRIPKSALTQVWVEKTIVVPHSNRCCDNHLEGKLFTADAMALITATKKGIICSDEELGTWILNLREHLPNCSDQRRHLDFDNPLNIRTEDYPQIIGYARENFEDIYSTIRGHVLPSANRTAKNALGIFMVLLRHGLSQRCLAFLFGIKNQSTISDTIDTVLTALEKHHTSRWLGFNHISRDDAILYHSRDLFKIVYEVHDNPLFLTMDGTYIYIEKPTDFLLQKLTYSGQKGENLVKPFMIILASGYILEACGPFFADGKNNDAGILQTLIKKDGDLYNYVKKGDHFILDRGFRDVIRDIKKLGVNVHMPNLLPKTQKQFRTKDGNASRSVTLTRWPVENSIGRIKKKSKFLRDVVSCGYLEKVGSIYRVACGFSNAYCPPLTQNSAKNIAIAHKVVTLLNSRNALQLRIQREKLDNSGGWVLQAANDSSVPRFPVLSLSEIEQLTLGTYQIKLAKNYTRLHLDKDSGYVIMINTDVTDIVRAKIESRFTSNKIHNVFIHFDPEAEGYDAILGHYCQCRQGARTVGMCSHICAVIWYLAYQRHQDKPLNPPRHKLASIMDAAGRFSSPIVYSSDEDIASDDESIENESTNGEHFGDNGNEDDDESLLSV